MTAAVCRFFSFFAFGSVLSYYNHLTIGLVVHNFSPYLILLSYLYFSSCKWILWNACCTESILNRVHTDFSNYLGVSFSFPFPEIMCPIISKYNKPLIKRNKVYFTGGFKKLIRVLSNGLFV